MDTAAKFLVEDLLSSQIDTYFGIPGGPVSPVFDGIFRTNGARLIESRHETAAVFEAIGYYKSTGKIPVVAMTAGPGITNALTGIASAKALRIPLIIICGDVAWEQKDHILLQSGGPEGINIEATFAPHVEQIIRFRDPLSVSQQVMDALSARVGMAPLMLVFPLHISNHKIDKPIVRKIWKEIIKQAAPISAIEEANQLLSQANHPLIVIGYGAFNHEKSVNDLVDRLAIPVVCTPQAKGIIPDDHPMSLRHGGLGASQWIREYVKNVPDVVLALGTDLDDCAIGTTEYLGKNTKLIHVDINPKVFNRKYHTDVAILASLEQVCPLLNINDKKNHMGDIKNISPFDVVNFNVDDGVPIAPHRILADLQASCPNNTRYVSDIGEHMLFCLHYLSINKEQQFSIDLGLGAMGSGICQAIGMCLGDRRPTVCICGDGCFQMHGMEILTAIKHRLPIVFVIFNDARYNMVWRGFQAMFNIRGAAGETDCIDFAAIADILGIHGFKIDSPGSINEEIMDFFFKDGPAIFDVRINKDVFITGTGRNEVLKHMGESNG